VRVMRTTLFGHKPFLADGRMVYLQHLVEGRGDEGTLRKQDVISLSGEDNIPHEVQITVATSTQAAQLALNDEAIRLEGRLSQETLFQDYMKIKNIPLERKRLTDDILRRATYEVTIQRAVTEAAAAIAARTPPGAAAVLPPTETPGAGAGGNGRVPGPVTSAQPTPAQPEDVGTMMGSEQGGVEPMMEGAQP